MQPLFALIISILFSTYLLYLDFKQKPNVSYALWIPFIWLLIVASRMVNLWFMPESSSWAQSDVSQVAEGNPIDRNIFLILTIIGFIILLKRKISWSNFVKNNIWIFLLFTYFAISILWTDYPYVSFKRYIKAIGCLVMAMIVITEVNPLEAFKTMVRRCSYILIPLSIILIKYFPIYGRSYHRWSGKLSITGVTTNKNSLGALCLVCGIVIFGDLISYLRKQNGISNTKYFLLQLIVFLMILWLLISCDSATSFMCFIIGISIFIVMGLHSVQHNTKKIGHYFFTIVFILMILEFTFNISGIIFGSLGRDSTLTGRIELWKDALAMKTNPFIGVGFEAFWLGDRMEFFWAKHTHRPSEIHNGYLETYLNLGIIGVSILITVIISSYKKIANKLVSNYNYARLFITYYTIILIFNVTESAFQPMHLIGFIFLITAMDTNSSKTILTESIENLSSLEKNIQ